MSKSGKFVKETKNVPLPVLGISIASCGKKLLRISEHLFLQQQLKTKNFDLQLAK